MSLVRVTFLSGLTTLVRLAAGLVVTKVLAVYVGPGGLALLGNFSNFVGMVGLISSGGLTNGVTKYVAEYRNDPAARDAILNAAFRALGVFSLLVSVAVLLSREFLARQLFHSDAYGGPLLVLGFAAIPIGVGTLLLAILNGTKRFGAFFSVNLAAAILGMLGTVCLTMSMGLKGAAYAVALGPVLLLAAAIPLSRKGSPLNRSILCLRLSNDALKKLARFSAMTLVSAISIPLTFVFVRSYLIAEVSLEGAGQWQGIWRISEAYLSVVTATLSVYYLPRFSELTDSDALRKEIFRGYRLLLPLSVVASAAVYLSREFLVALLYTEEFRGMLALFPCQVLGDFFKVASWMLGFLTVAKSMTRVYIACEIGFLASFAALTVLFVKAFGLVGVTYAYSLNYLAYLITMVWVFRGLLFPAGARAGRVR